MIGNLVNLFKLFILLISNLIHRIEKLVFYYLTGKHEFERICESQDDIYEKTFKIDQWLDQTHCKKIRNFLDRNFDPSNTSNSKPQQLIDDIIASFIGEFATPNELNRSESKSPGKRRVRFRSNHTGISNLEDGDLSLRNSLRDLTQELLDLILKSKYSYHIPNKNKESLGDILYSILGYKFSTLFAKSLADIKYDSEIDKHSDKLMDLWNNLVNEDQREGPRKKSAGSKVFPPNLSHMITSKSDIVSNRWSHIGFQGEDPGTDFRGMGLLGLIQLEYLSRKPNRLAVDLLERSLNEDYSYPFAIVGINITYNLLNLFKDGSMKHFYYDTGNVLFSNKNSVLNLLTIFNDIYVELFLRFDCFWHESKPKNIFEFRELMERFVTIVKLDLCNRNFNLKFIY